MIGRLVAALATALAALGSACPMAEASFGFQSGAAGFEAVARAEGGGAETVSGAHPYALTARLAFQGGSLRDLHLGMPAGLLVNPAVVGECRPTAFHTPRNSPFEASRSGEDCPASSQVGTVEVHSGLEGGSVRRFGLFELEAIAGASTQLGFAPFGVPIALTGHVVPDAAGRYSVALDGSAVSAALGITELDLTIWGTPWAASHDGERGDCLNEPEPAFPWAKCSVGAPINNRPRAYLTMPTSCDAPLLYTARADSWQEAGEASTSDAGPAQRGCGELRFAPQIFGQLTNRSASSSSGFQFDLGVDEEALTDPYARIFSEPRRAVVELPEGVTVNPSVGAGLGVCTPAQYASEAPFSAPGQGCPGTSKIGDFSVVTPLFSKQLEGAVYLAQPDDPSTSAPGAENPFDSLLAVYLVTRSAERGVLVKVAGRIDADPVTGRLTATFDGLPQLPYSDLQVNLRPGQRAPLVTPDSCGSATTGIALAPWAGGVPERQSATDWQIESGVGGGPCPPGGAAAFHPGAIAGGVNSAGGAYTPYYVRLTRRDDEQEITSYSMVLPKGITARLAGIPFCSEAAIAAARGRRGRDETADPSCPAASLIGHTLAGYGVGSALAYARGAVYLAGPFHGSPLSVVTVDPAVVGPFDLGTIVIRSGFEVDPLTAQLRIDSRGSEPIPHILDGVPLRLRDVRVYMDRPDFTRNPTSCEPSELVSTLTGAGARFDDPGDDSSATVGVHFQLLDCRSLGFRPKLGLRLRGGHRRGAYPALRAVFAARPGDANLQRIAVTMPHSEFLAQNHIRKVCTREQFAAGRCPAGSIYGHAVAYTPLLDRPLSGPVYLRSSSHRLPDLVASLYSGAVHIVLDGRIGPAKHGIRTFFGDLPDAPIGRFVLQMRGGRHGLLVNSVDICAKPPRATVKALGQNNLGRVFTTKLRGRCGANRGGRRHAHHHKRGGRRR